MRMKQWTVYSLIDHFWCPRPMPKGCVGGGKEGSYICPGGSKSNTPVGGGRPGAWVRLPWEGKEGRGIPIGGMKARPPGPRRLGGGMGGICKDAVLLGVGGIPVGTMGKSGKGGGSMFMPLPPLGSGGIFAWGIGSGFENGFTNGLNQVQADWPGVLDCCFHPV